MLTKTNNMSMLLKNELEICKSNLLNCSLSQKKTNFNNFHKIQTTVQMLQKVVHTKITIIWTTVSLNAYHPYYWAKSKYIKLAELTKNRSVR